ncbi:Gypsy retrotransposon integrase-like protein 1 [Oleoguttula sp. CCFEE 5521]
MSEIRTRVRKACDRCRLKKGKCDGHFPCNRCKGDDSVCGYSRRRIDRNRVYTRSYVELLERQRSHLVTGIHEMYKRLQQVDALPTSAAGGISDEPDIHSILDLLGVVNEDFDAGLNCEETSDHVIDMHQHQADRISKVDSMDSDHASDSECALSPASENTYSTSEATRTEATESLFSSGPAYDVAPAYNYRGPNLVQSPLLPASQLPWKHNFDEGRPDTLVMPASVWRAKAVEYALNSGHSSGDRSLSHATNTSCSSLERPRYCWPSAHIDKDKHSLSLANGVRPGLGRQDSGTAVRAGLGEQLSITQWDGILDAPNALPAHSDGLDGLYFSAWDPMESTYQTL